MTIDDCYGCAMKKNDKGDYCDHITHNNESEEMCPCTKCLVKSTCTGECEDWAKWVRG